MGAIAREVLSETSGEIAREILREIASETSREIARDQRRCYEERERERVMHTCNRAFPLQLRKRI